VKILSDTAGQRLDQAIARTLQDSGEEVSVREVRRALKQGDILIDNRRRAPGDRARGSEVVTLVHFIAQSKREIRAEPGLLKGITVLYEDECLLALDKPSGIHTLPQTHLEANTLLGAAVAHAPEIQTCGPPLEGGALHRLDHGTSGVVLFAKNAADRERLRASFRIHEVQKEYRAIVHDPNQIWDSARAISDPIDSSTPKVRVRDSGLSARTEVEQILRTSTQHSLLRAVTKTGRRHQIRVHLAHAGTPILGDPIYGAQDKGLRLALHANALKLPSGLLIESELPAQLECLLT
jgi:23S rRNA pseudouridine1911/1915/1917 synthase